MSFDQSIEPSPSFAEVWSFNCDRNRVLLSHMLLLRKAKLRPVLESIYCSPEIGEPLGPSISAYARDLIYASLREKVGPQFSERLRSLLEGPLVKEYRFCGGSILRLLTDDHDDFPGDIDLYVTPNDEVSFMSGLVIGGGFRFDINREANDRSPGKVHDIKIRQRDSDDHALDLVFRHECQSCPHIDAFSCRSGLYGSGTEYRLDVIDFGLLRVGKIRVKDNISPQREEKLNSKGLNCVRNIIL